MYLGAVGSREGLEIIENSHIPFKPETRSLPNIELLLRPLITQPSIARTKAPIKKK